jgi:hypothetical protein
VIADQALKVQMGTDISECVGTFGECNYQTSSSMPVVTSVIKSDSNTLEFSGSGFNIDSFTAKVSLANVIADEVTIESDTLVKAIFRYGVPVTSGAVVPSLSFFDSRNEAIIDWAQIPTSVAVTNALTATSISAPIDCSFAGGCLV